MRAEIERATEVPVPHLSSPAVASALNVQWKWEVPFEPSETKILPLQGPGFEFEAAVMHGDMPGRLHDGCYLFRAAVDGQVVEFYLHPGPKIAYSAMLRKAEETREKGGHGIIALTLPKMRLHKEFEETLVDLPPDYKNTKGGEEIDRYYSAVNLEWDEAGVTVKALGAGVARGGDEQPPPRLSPCDCANSDFSLAIRVGKRDLLVAFVDRQAEKAAFECFVKQRDDPETILDTIIKENLVGVRGPLLVLEKPPERSELRDAIARELDGRRGQGPLADRLRSLPTGKQCAMWTPCVWARSCNLMASTHRGLLYIFHLNKNGELCVVFPNKRIGSTPRRKLGT